MKPLYGAYDADGEHRHRSLAISELWSAGSAEKAGGAGWG